jgi:alpha-L-arabinofuranosidase
MRRDVIDALKSTGFRGLFRYPGGCFAEFYRWQIGLLDPDMRPPISTPHDYCAAVGGGVNAYTAGTMQNGVGIDDFLALTEELGMEPAITVRLVNGSNDEISEAAAWVEYCNGDAETTKWGRVRAARGRTEPYNVKYWYLGNEISQQVRYPSYPADMTRLGPCNKTQYAEMVLKLAPAMLKASPQLPLRLFAVAGDAAWNAAWAAAVGDNIYATSSHAGYTEQPRTSDDWTAEKITAAVKRPLGEFLTSLEQLQNSLNSTGKNIVISADEWGLGSPWLVKTFGVAHGMYAASFLSAVTRAPPSTKLQLTNYFEPINEGAITVGPSHASLTPVGQVMGLYAQHQGGMRVLTSQVDADNNLDVLATLHPDKKVVATVTNLNAVGWTTYNLTLQFVGWECDAAAVTELRAQGFTEASMFETSQRNITVSGSKLELAVPPLSVVHLSLSVQSVALYV